MLTRERFRQLYRALRDEPVLSLYLEADQHDPAQRSQWRTRLRNEVSRLRDELRAREEDTEALDNAVARLEAELPGEGFLQGRGWSGFITPHAVHYLEPVPFPVPTRVTWGRGPSLAHYLRGLKQLRHVVVVVADRRKARFLRYGAGMLEEETCLVAHGDVGDVSESGVRKAPSRATGTRGATAEELAERFLEVEADRLHQIVVDRMVDEAGGDGFVLLGGPRETEARLKALLPRGFRKRSRVVTGLAMEESPEAMLPRVEAAVSELSRRLEDALLAEILDDAREGGRGRLGLRAVRRALRENRVDRLVLSQGFVEREPGLADRIVAEALDVGSEVELLVGEPALRLDEEGKGVGARLRY